MLLLNTPIVAYQKIKHCFFYLYIVCICNVCLCSHFLITTIKQRQGFLSFTHFGLNIHHPFLYFLTLKVSQFRVPSRLLLLSVLSCHVQQLMVGAISADRCSGSARITSWLSPNSRSFPHSHICPCFLFLVVSRCFVIACVLCENRFLSDPLFPCAVGLIAQRSRSLCGPQTLPASSGISASLSSC